jgi:hypothetical protein
VPVNWNGPQPAPRALWRLIHTNFPQARFLGIYARRNIAGTNRPSLHAGGRALDIGLLVASTIEKIIGDGLFQAFVELGSRMGLEEVIWNRQIWSRTRPMVHPYHGSSPHTDHVHIGFTGVASQQTLFPMLLSRIAILWTGLEDRNKGLRRAMQNLAWQDNRCSRSYSLILLANPRCQKLCLAYAVV